MTVPISVITTAHNTAGVITTYLAALATQVAQAMAKLWWLTTIQRMTLRRWLQHGPNSLRWFRVVNAHVVAALGDFVRPLSKARANPVGAGAANDHCDA